MRMLGDINDSEVEKLTHNDIILLFAELITSLLKEIRGERVRDIETKVEKLGR